MTQAVFAANTPKLTRPQPGNVRPAAVDTLTLSQTNLGNVFSSAETVKIPFSTTGTSVSWTSTDFYGAATSGGPLAVNAQGNNAIQPNLGRLGYFALHVTASNSGGSVVASADTTFAVLAPTSLQTKSDSPFGVCTHFAQGWNTDVMALVARAGIANFRDEQYWQTVEETLTSPPTYDFSAFQPYMNAAATVGLFPSMELDFSNSNYDGGATPYTTAGDAGYAAYAAAMVNHYGAALGSVQVWNEYNGSYCYGTAASNKPLYYTNMLQAAYQAVKQVSPTTTVVGGACVPVPLPWFQSLFANGALDYMDAIDTHPYVNPPEGLEINLAALETLSAQYNHGNGPKPIWATECGYVDTVNPGRQLMASYLVRIITLMRTSGVARAFWYALYDVSDSYSGLLRAPTDALGVYAPTSAYPAYANLVQQLYGATFVAREATDGRTRFYHFSRATDGKDVRVLWSTDGTAQLVLSASTPLTIVNIMGEAVTVTPTNGLVAVSTDINPVFVVGPVTGVREVERDQLVADSIQDFSGVQGQSNWYYGCYDGDITAYSSNYNSYWESLTYGAGDTEYEWTLQAYGYVKYPPGFVDQNGAHPSNRPNPSDPSGNYTQVWYGRRWQSNVAGLAHLTGTISRSSTLPDGSTAKVFVDGVQVYSYTVGPADPNDPRDPSDPQAQSSAQSAQLDVHAQINVGSEVDFLITPGPKTTRYPSGSSDVNYDYVSFPVKIAVPAAAPASFSAWQGQNFTAAQIVNTAVSGDTASPAGDGLPNLLKYALGLNPGTPAISPVQTDTTTGYLRMTVPKDPAAADLTYSVEATSDLTNPASWSSNGLTTNQNSSSVLQVSDNVPIQGGTRRFLRLRVKR